MVISSSKNKKKLEPESDPAHQQESSILTIDDLARERICEIESSLNTATKFKLAQIDTWFFVLKGIITSADLHTAHVIGGKDSDNQDATKSELGESIYADYIDDCERFDATDLTEHIATNPVKWTIRVQAFKIIRRIVEIIASLGPTTCDSSYVLGYLPDLVRISFVAATSPYDDLKIQGFSMFKYIIKRFARIEDEELKGQPILEQYRTQILSALKPAFNLDAPPYIAALAGQACSLWMILGLDRNIFDMKRTYQLFLASLHKLKQQNSNQHSQLYTESELEQERLDILGSWAYLYIASQDSGHSTGSDQLSRDLCVLIEPCLDSLVDQWWEAMRDYALLIIPAPRLTYNLHEDDTVYTREVALRLFHPVWPKLTLALTIWLCQRQDKNKQNCNDLIKCSKFICGLIVKELCDCQSSGHPSQRDLFDSTIYSFKALDLLMNDRDICDEIVSDAIMAKELYILLYGAYVKICGDPIKALLKRCMDSLFSANLDRICKRPHDTAIYSTAKLVTIIERELEAMQSRSEEKSRWLGLDYKDRLTISMGNLMITLKLQFEQISIDIRLISRVIGVFNTIIEFEPDRTFGLALISQSKDLYDEIKKYKHGPSFISQIFFSKAKQLSWTIKSMYQDRSGEKDPKPTDSLEMILESMLFDLGTCSDDNYRKSMSRRLITELLKSVHQMEQSNCKSESELTSMSGKHPLTLIIKTIKVLISTYADHLEEEIKEQLEDAARIQIEMSEKISQTKIAIPESTSSKRVPSQAKITLRSDFSNFYAQNYNRHDKNAIQ